MTRMSDALTVGVVATALRASPRTVAKWIDRGLLPGYRVPLSRDRRVLLPAALRFARQNGLPTDRLEDLARRRGLEIPEAQPQLPEAA